MCVASKLAWCFDLAKRLECVRFTAAFVRHAGRASPSGPGVTRRHTERRSAARTPNASRSRGPAGLFDAQLIADLSLLIRFQ